MNVNESLTGSGANPFGQTAQCNRAGPERLRPKLRKARMARGARSVDYRRVTSRTNSLSSAMECTRRTKAGK